MSRGITITNYLYNGNPEGIIFSYMSNWSGQAIKIPRNLFAEAKSMPELQRPGLYILLGANIENPEDKMVYIGEGNNLAARIGQHLFFFIFLNSVSSKIRSFFVKRREY